MRNMLALVGAAVVTILGVGWYLDWFTVHREPSPTGKGNVNVEFNTNKISEDLHKGGQKLQGFIDKKSEKSEETPPNPFNLIPTSVENNRFDSTSLKEEKSASPSDGPQLDLPTPPSIPVPR